ncbi:MAG: hypothetical protein WC541_10105 [Dehalococcoidia bacterium]
MNHPLNSIPGGKRLTVFLWLLAATIGISIVFRFIGPFKPTIVDYELAGSVAKSSLIIGAWDTLARLQACFNLGFDYLYMPVYSTTIALACVMGADVIARTGWKNLGLLLAWGLWLAAVLDAIENYALITMMYGSPADPYPQIAAYCASIKFGLIILGLLYALISLIVFLVKLSRQKLVPLK